VAPNDIKLVAFDMEGCLTDDPTVWEIMHRKLGTWESHGQPYWKRYLAGEFGYDAFARMDVAVWQGAPLALLREAADEVPLMPGCTEVLTDLHRQGVSLAIITNGLLCVARRFEKALGIERIYANEIRVKDDLLTGDIEIKVPYHAKGYLLRSLAAEFGLERGEVASVGDSKSDIAMFRESGISIAFNPLDPAVIAAATHHVPNHDLRPILDILKA
jgi:phosphoserine phosphatase